MEKKNFDAMVETLNEVDCENEVLFDEKIEGYSSCGESAAAYRCKRDCIFSHNAIISAVE